LVIKIVIIMNKKL